MELFPKGRLQIYLNTKCLDFFLKKIFPVIISSVLIEIVLAISRAIRRCLPPVMPLRTPHLQSVSHWPLKEGEI